MESADLLGYAAGTLVIISLLPQVVQCWRTKSTKDISLARYIFYVAGISLWVLYALTIGNGPISIMFSVELFLAICVLALKLKYG